MSELRPYSLREIDDLKARMGHFKSGRFPFVWWDPDTGLLEADRLVEAINSLRAALESCEDYFADKADADCVGDPARYVGNLEMTLLGEVRRALGKEGY